MFFRIKKSLDVEQATVEKDVEAEYKVPTYTSYNCILFSYFCFAIPNDFFPIRILVVIKKCVPVYFVFIIFNLSRRCDGSLVAHQTYGEEVPGSNPASPILLGPLSYLSVEGKTST